MTKNHQFYIQSTDGGSDLLIIVKPQSHIKSKIPDLRAKPHVGSGEKNSK